MIHDILWMKYVNDQEVHAQSSFEPPTIPPFIKGIFDLFKIDRNGGIWEVLLEKKCDSKTNWEGLSRNGGTATL